MAAYEYFHILLVLAMLFCVDVDGQVPEDEDGEISRILKEYSKQREMDRVKSHVESYGVADIAKQILKSLDNYKMQELNLAIAGNSGSGKSSLVNTLRGLHAKDEGAAEVGVTETTKYVQSYKHPQLPNYSLFDLPGIGTPNFPKYTYISDTRLMRYDCLIICSAKRFTENDLWLANEAKKLHITFVFVRTHTDVDMDNAKDEMGDSFIEHDVLRRIRVKINDYLRLHGHPTDATFLISTKLKHTAKWDYGAFLDYISNRLPKRAKEAFVMSLIASSKEIIYKKKHALEQRITKVALYAALSDGFSGNGQDLLDDEITFYKEQLGLIKSGPPSHFVVNTGTNVLSKVAFGSGIATFLGPFIPAAVMMTTSIYSTATSYYPYKAKLQHSLDKFVEEALAKLTPIHNHHSEL